MRVRIGTAPGLVGLLATPSPGPLLLLEVGLVISLARGLVPLSSLGEGRLLLPVASMRKEMQLSHITQHLSKALIAIIVCLTFQHLAAHPWGGGGGQGRRFDGCGTSTGTPSVAMDLSQST